jgi:uncharacterized protein
MGLSRRGEEGESNGEPMLRMGDSGAKGKGVFAARRIEPSEMVWDYAGDERWIKDIPSELWPHCFQVDYDRCVVPVEGSTGWFINHSCEPNCVIMGKTRIVALRRIESEEEITFDYSTNVDRDDFSMACECGMKECRKTVRSYRFLPEELKGHYGACVSTFLLRPIKLSSDEQRS